MSASGWNPVSHSNLCPICEGPDNCTISDDGNVVFCGRVSEGSIRENNGGQFLHVRAGMNNATTANYVYPSQRAKPKPQPSKPADDWGGMARNLARNADAERRELAGILGVSVDSLTALGVGFHRAGNCWTIPERDATGRVIGLRRRFRDGSKKPFFGHRAGLTYADDWAENPGAIFLVEGGSDVASLMTMELAVAGRPSNLGGVQMLGELLADVSAEREIIVVGERDRKSQEELKPKVRKNHDPQCSGCLLCWPGRYGAIRTASQLAESLRRPIAWSFPPNGAKDVREWLQSESGGPTMNAQLAERFLLGLEVQTIEPPKLFVPPDPAGDVVDLVDYRNAMESARLQSVDNPGVYLDTSPTGAGKSFADSVALQQVSSALIVLPTHENCDELEEELRGVGIDAAAYPRRFTSGGGPGESPNCWNTDADAADAIGLSATAAVCPTCKHRADCESYGYLLELWAASEAPVGIATHQRAAYQGLAKLGAGRSFQAIHEDAVSILRPTHELSAGDLLQCQAVLHWLLNDPKWLDWFGSDRRMDKDGQWISDPKQRERRDRIYVFLQHLAEVADWVSERLHRAERTEQLTPRGSMPKPAGTDQLLFKTSREVGASYSSQPWRVLLAVGTGDLLSLGVVRDEAFKRNKSDTAKTDSCSLEQPADANRDRVVC